MSDNLSDVLVELHGLEKTYRMGEQLVHALRGVSLTVNRGELVAVMGASGSGKSTLLNVLGTLDRPDAGTASIDGVRLDALDEGGLAELRNSKIGFVFQAFHLLQRDTALENVELPMVYAGVSPRIRRERALKALARVGLADRAHHLPTQLSGGQQQRVSIARALVNEPVMLLADEPTGALDSETSKSVMELLLELHAQGMTILIVTHDPQVAAYAQRVVRFLDGSIVSDTRSSARAGKTAGALSERAAP